MARSAIVSACEEKRPADMEREAAPLSVGIETLGCRLNQFESDGILSKFVETGRYRAVDTQEGPDVAIINTCTVTDQADSRNRKAIEQAKKRNPAAFVVVTGCYAQTDPEQAAAFSGVDLVVGNDRKSRLFEIIEEHLGGIAYAPPSSDRAWTGLADAGYGARPVLDDPFAYGTVLPQGHTRAYLKIQEGCDRACSYCKIPMARGRGVSRRVDDVLEHVTKLQDAGIPEIVLTGVNLGWYRDRDADVRFGALVGRILKVLKGTRLRLSSIEPCDVDAQLAELTLHPMFCDFLHVPVQSGSDEILRSMRRTYSAASFRKRIETVKRVNPSIFLGTDVIVGFPGEGPNHFAESLSLCDNLEMANIHAFRYSPRRGTPASQLTDRPAGVEVKRRMEAVRDLKEKTWEKYVASERGRLRSLVVEKVMGKEVSGLTDNFLRVSATVEREVGKGSVIPVEIGPAIGPGVVMGRPAQNVTASTR